MDLLHSDSADITIRLSEDEIDIINNAVNEVCHGLEVPEFSTRIGAELDEVKKLLQQIHEIRLTIQRKENE